MAGGRLLCSREISSALGDHLEGWDEWERGSGGRGLIVTHQKPAQTCKAIILQ